MTHSDLFTLVTLVFLQMKLKLNISYRSLIICFVGLSFLMDNTHPCNSLRRVKTLTFGVCSAIVLFGPPNCRFYGRFNGVLLVFPSPWQLGPGHQNTSYKRLCCGCGVWRSKLFCKQSFSFLNRDPVLYHELPSTFLLILHVINAVN